MNEGKEDLLQNKIAELNEVEGLSKVTTHEQQGMEPSNSITGKIEVHYRGSYADDAHIQNESFTKFQQL